MSQRMPGTPPQTQDLLDLKPKPMRGRLAALGDPTAHGRPLSRTPAAAPRAAEASMAVPRAASTLISSVRPAPLLSRQSSCDSSLVSPARWGLGPGATPVSPLPAPRSELPFTLRGLAVWVFHLRWGFSCFLLGRHGAKMFQLRGKERGHPPSGTSGVHGAGGWVAGEPKSLLPFGAGWRKRIAGPGGQAHRYGPRDGRGQPRAGFAARRLRSRPDSEPRFPHL